MKITIDGVPIRGDKYQGLTKWKQAIINQTKDIKRIDYPCCAKIDFILQENQHPTDRPHGPDLDNLLKPLLDGLQKTILDDDSLIYGINVTKRAKRPHEKTGAVISIKKFKTRAASHFQK